MHRSNPSSKSISVDEPTPVGAAGTDMSCAPVPRPLLTELDFRWLLGKVSERKFKELRADHVIPDPLELGPRMPRWTYDDYEAVVATLRRRNAIAEPESLAAGRRERIQRLKAAPNRIVTEATTEPTCTASVPKPITSAELGMTQRLGAAEAGLAKPVRPRGNRAISE